jgi:hypothetical protein
MIFRKDFIAAAWLTVRPALTSASPRSMPAMVWLALFYDQALSGC